jgi:hypothetical protein
MRRIVYAGGTFITGDEVADALLDYAAVLANLERAATISVPAIGESGPTEVKVLVGPASQVLSEASDHAGPEPDAADFIREVEEATRQGERRFSLPAPESPVDWDVEPLS